MQWKLKVRSQGLLFFLLSLLQFNPLLAYSLKSCTVTSPDNTTEVWVGCSDQGLAAVPDDVPRNATSLDLSSNHIVMINSGDFNSLSKLRYLHMKTNWISGVDDGAFGDLSELLELEMDKNNFTKLSDNMFHGLWKLTILSLEENQITHVSPRALQSLISLKTVRLNYNQLQTVEIRTILQLPNLQELFLEFNILTSFQTNNLQVNTSNLRTLSIGHNYIQRFSITTDIFPHLQSVHLSGPSGLKWDVPNSTFLRSLTVLDLHMVDVSCDTFVRMLQSTESLQTLALTAMTNRRVLAALVGISCRNRVVTSLDLSENGFVTIADTLLRSCSQLTELDLSFNDLQDMSDLALTSLKQLRCLELNNNYLKTVPRAIRGLSTLEIFNLSFNFISELTCSDFLNLTRLTELHLDQNRISVVDGCVFQDLKNLRVLNISGNAVRKLVDFFKVNSKKLEVLDLSGNFLIVLKQGDFRNLPSLRYLDLQSGKYYPANNGAFEGLNGLKTLIVTPFMHNVMNFTGMPQLENLKLLVTFSLKSSYDNPEPPFTHLPSLKNLIIEKYDGQYDMSADFLKGLKCLENFRDVKAELFQPIPNLQALDLSNNKLRSLDFLIWANLSALRQLTLRHNELTVINETVLQSLPALTYLDLFGNPFSCDCSNAGFIQWVISNNQTQVVNAHQYDCAFPLSKKGTKLLDFDVQSCWMDVSFLCFISSTCLVVLTLLSSFIYHFLRWQLAYGFYLFLAFLYDSRKKKKGTPHQFDAFVSYNVHDEAWVYREMLPVLEEEQGWRLCLHHRDFQPGKPIMENITDAIYGSRKTICVISRHYLQSEWCSREIQMASFRLFDEHKDVLILLFLEEIPTQQLSPYYRMRKTVKRRTYLSWPQAGQHTGVFWQNVRRALETGDGPTDNNLLTGPADS
uniref:TIR domain-containing protein n=1 Tax=Anabas testudineus TaxID=64144 RepID=A0A3Q1IH40_ANATE